MFRSRKYICFYLRLYIFVNTLKEIVHKFKTSRNDFFMMIEFLFGFSNRKLLWRVKFIKDFQRTSWGRRFGTNDTYKKLPPINLSIWKTNIWVFPDHFSFNYFFGQFLLFLEIKTELIQFYAKFQIKQAQFFTILMY